MIIYKNSLDGITKDQLEGFFVGWKKKPSKEKLFKLLENSYKICLAVDGETTQVIGLITAISDKVLSAYIPFLEVLPEFQNQGIGKELLKRLLGELDNLYMIDLSCDPEMQEWYQKSDLAKSVGMRRRNYDKQSGI